MRSCRVFSQRNVLGIVRRDRLLPKMGRDGLRAIARVFVKLPKVRMRDGETREPDSARGAVLVWNGLGLADLVIAIKKYSQTKPVPGYRKACAISWKKV